MTMKVDESGSHGQSKSARSRVDIREEGRNLRHTSPIDISKRNQVRSIVRKWTRFVDEKRGQLGICLEPLDRKLERTDLPALGLARVQRPRSQVRKRIGRWIVTMSEG